MPRPEQTGYIIVSLMSGDDDAPASDPGFVMEQLADKLGNDVQDVVEMRLAFTPDGHAFYGYGGGLVR